MSPPPTPSAGSATASSSSSISLYIILSLYYLLSNLLQTIQQSDTLAQALQAAQETLEARVHERTAAAELALQEAETARATLETQMWFATGEAELNEAMHGEQEIPQLAQNITIHLCRYLQIPIGALYLLNNQHMRLELAGAFAYRPAPDAPTSFRIGEGLVGEAAQQRRQLLIQNAPLSLLSLESSLGMDSCAYLLLQPIWYEHLLLGVLVFGHWQPFTIAQTEFVQTDYPKHGRGPTHRPHPRLHQPITRTRRPL
jgi:transcriptional regulator with GAF, ATPase, and Fis domain